MKKTVSAFLSVIMLLSMSGQAESEGTWTIIPDAPPVYDRTEIIVDTQGNVWFSSIDYRAEYPCFRIYRYNGLSWQSFSERDIIVSDNNEDYELAVYWPNADLAASSDGSVWVMTDYGLSRYNNGKWNSFPFTHTKGMCSSDHDLKVDGNGTVWCGYRETVISFKDGIWTHHDETRGQPQSNLYVNAFAAGVNDHVCMSFKRPLEDIVNNDITFTVMEHGTYYYDGNSWHPTTFNNITGPVIHDANFISLAQSQDGTFWGIHNFSLWKMYNSVWKPVLSGSLPGIKELAVDTRGNIWSISSISVYRYNHDKYLKYYEKDGVPPGRIEAIAAGLDGEMWVATKKGIGKFTPGEVSVAAQSPAAFELKENYPNPFNPSTTIGFTLDAPHTITLNIYNIAGQKVCELLSGHLKPGIHSVRWNGLDDFGNAVSTGTYIAKLSAEKHTQSLTMTLVK